MVREFSITDIILLMDTLSVRIAETRKLRGLSQKELADRIGVTKSAISQYESLTTSKNIEPTIAKAIKIAHALDVSFEWLATGKGVKGIEEFLIDMSEKLHDDKRLVFLPKEQKLLLALFNDLPKEWQKHYSFILEAIHTKLSH